MDHETDCGSLEPLVDLHSHPGPQRLLYIDFLDSRRHCTDGIGRNDACSLTVQSVSTGSVFSVQWEHRLEN